MVYIFPLLLPLFIQINTAGNASCTKESVERAARWGTTLLRDTPASTAQKTVSFATAHTSAHDVSMATS